MTENNLRTVTAFPDNVIQDFCTNGVNLLGGTCTVIVALPLRISGLSHNNQLVVRDSAPAVNYQVLATTNPAQPFTPISPVIPGTGSSTFFQTIHQLNKSSTKS